MDKKTSEELMHMLGLNETLNKLAKTNEVRWYGDVFRTEDDDVLREHSRPTNHHYNSPVIITFADLSGFFFSA